MMTWPSAVTTSTASRLSTVRPYLPISQPSPPARVRPAIPVLETTPPVVASPWPAAARLSSFQVAPPCPYRPPRRVNPDPLHRRQVDHQAAVGNAQAGHVVAAAAHRYLGRLLAADGDRVHDVRDGAAPGDKRGVLVDQAVVDLAGLLVARLCRGDQLAGERGPDLAGNLDRAAHVVSPLQVLWPTMASGRASGVS